MRVLRAVSVGAHSRRMMPKIALALDRTGSAAVRVEHAADELAAASAEVRRLARLLRELVAVAALAVLVWLATR